MSLSNAVFKTGASWAPTGGTDMTLAPDGRVVKNGLSLVVSADSNLLTRRGFVFTATLPAMPASPGAYAKLARNSVVHRIPFVAADGKLYIQSIRVEGAFHSEYTGKNTAYNDVAALVSDSDFSGFWQSSLLV